MSEQGQVASENSSDWVSYSSGSSRSASEGVNSSVGLLSTLKRNSWLTSYFHPHQLLARPSLRSRRNGKHNGAGKAHLGGVDPLPEAAAAAGLQSRVAQSNSKTEPLPKPKVPDLPQNRSQLSTTDQTYTFAPSHRHARNRVPSLLNNPSDNQHGDAQPTPRVYLLPSPSVTCPGLLPHVHVWSSVAKMDPNNPTQSPNLADLLTSLSSHEDANRKMAAFKLQSLINDPSFAEHFVISGGLPKLRALILGSTGNTLAYSLASFARLLEVDQGWEAVNDQVVEKARIHSIFFEKMDRS